MGNLIKIGSVVKSVYIIDISTFMTEGLDSRSRICDAFCKEMDRGIARNFSRMIFQIFWYEKIKTRNFFWICLSKTLGNWRNFEWGGREICPQNPPGYAPTSGQRAGFKPRPRFKSQMLLKPQIIQINLRYQNKQNSKQVQNNNIKISLSSPKIYSTPRRPHKKWI